MSIPPSPSSPGRSPKRKRSDSQDYGSPARLQYAYDDDLSSDAENTFHTPAQGSDEADLAKSQEFERPSRLYYTPYMTLRGHKRGVAAVKFSPDGAWIASCSADGTVKIWNARTGQLSVTLEGHLAGISTISWSPDSKVIASGSDDKIIRLWNVSTGKSFPSPFVGHHNYVYSVAFSPKGNMIVSGSYDEAVFLWDVRTARLMRSLPAHSDPVSGVDFVRDGTLIASCSSDGLIRIWDTSTGQCLKTLVHEDNAPVTSVRFSPNGKYVLAATLDSCVRLWDYVNGRCVKTYQGHRNDKYSLSTVFGTYGTDAALQDPSANDLSPNWAFAAIGSEDGKTVIWDVSSKEIMQVLEGHDDVVLGVDVSPDNQSIVTCSKDKTIKVWRRRVPPPQIIKSASASPPTRDMPSDEDHIRDSDA